MNKSDAGADPHPIRVLWSSVYPLLSETLLLTLRIICRVPFPIDLLFVASFSFIITFVGQIRVPQLWFGPILFLVFKILFLFIASFDFWLAVFSVIGRIIFAQWWVWRLWLLLRNLWYVLFPAFSLQCDYYVDSVSGLSSGVFVPTGVEFKCDIFVIVVFVPIGVES